MDSLVFIDVSLQSLAASSLQSMHQNNIRHLVLVDKETLAGIITDKDIFKVVTNNQTAMSSLGSIEPVAGQKAAFEQFTEYWFRDIFIGSK